MVGGEPAHRCVEPALLSTGAILCATVVRRLGNNNAVFDYYRVVRPADQAKYILSLEVSHHVGVFGAVESIVLALQFINRKVLTGK